MTGAWVFAYVFNEFVIVTIKKRDVPSEGCPELLVLLLLNPEVPKVEDLEI